MLVRKECHRHGSLSSNIELTLTVFALALRHANTAKKLTYCYTGRTAVMGSLACFTVYPVAVCSLAAHAFPVWPKHKLGALFRANLPAHGTMERAHYLVGGQGQRGGRHKRFFCQQPDYVPALAPVFFYQKIPERLCSSFIHHCLLDGFRIPAS